MWFQIPERKFGFELLLEELVSKWSDRKVIPLVRKNMFECFWISVQEHFAIAGTILFVNSAEESSQATPRIFHHQFSLRLEGLTSNIQLDNLVLIGTDLLHPSLLGFHMVLIVFDQGFLKFQLCKQVFELVEKFVSFLTIE